MVFGALLPLTRTECGIDRVPFFPMNVVLAVHEALDVCLLGEDTDFAGF